MKRYILLALSVCQSLVVLAAEAPRKSTDANLFGHVVDRDTHEHIAYASVAVVGTAFGTTTDASGHYFLKNLPVGELTLEVRALGYASGRMTVALERGETRELNFEVAQSGISMDEVVVSASRSETLRREAPALVSVLDAGLFERANASCLAQGLSFQPGVRVEDDCQNCGFTQVRINGLDGHYSQILVDSHPVFSSLTGVYGLEQIPANMIERVEVLRGGGSALYGSSAIGGTINIITRAPTRSSAQQSHTLTSLGGSNSYDNNTMLNASIVSESGRAGISVFGQSRHRSGYDHDGDGYTELPNLRNQMFGMRSYLRTGDHSKLTLEYHGINEFRRGGNKFDLQPHEADITEQTKHIINSGGLSYDLFWREYKHKISLYGSIQHTDRNSYYGAQKDMNAYGKTDDLTWVAGGMYVGNMNNCLFAPATFTGGLEYQNNSLHDVMTGYHRDMQQDVRIASAFVQNEWKMNVLTMLVGARLDKHNLIDKLIFSPRVNLLYKPTEDFQARLTYSTGFRAPQAYDEDLHVTAVGGEGVQIKLADNLREERSNSYSGSVDWTAHLGHWQANILVEGFYTDLRHVFVLEDIGKNDVGDVIKERRNGNGARVYGANLDAKIAHGKEAQLQLGFTAQRSRYTREEVWTQVDGKDLTTKRMPRTPDYYGYFTFSSAPLKNFDFSLSGTYTGKMIVPHYAGYIAEDRMETTPQFFDLNLKLNYTFVLHDHIKFQLNTGVQNIFNSFQKDLDKGEFRDAGYFYGPTQPRTFFIGFKIMN